MLCLNYIKQLKINVLNKHLVEEPETSQTTNLLIRKKCVPQTNEYLKQFKKCELKYLYFKFKFKSP